MVFASAKGRTLSMESLIRLEDRASVLRRNRHFSRSMKKEILAAQPGSCGDELSISCLFDQIMVTD
jgi:hypothetical protein